MRIYHSSEYRPGKANFFTSSEISIHLSNFKYYFIKFILNIQFLNTKCHLVFIFRLNRFHFHSYYLEMKCITLLNKIRVFLHHQVDIIVWSVKICEMLLVMLCPHCLVEKELANL